MSKAKKVKSDFIDTDKVYDDIAKALEHASTATDESRDKVKQILHNHYSGKVGQEFGTFKPED